MVFRDTQVIVGPLDTSQLSLTELGKWMRAPSNHPLFGLDVPRISVAKVVVRRPIITAKRGIKVSSTSFNLLSFKGKMKVLHMTWFAFFLTFVVWFNLAPLLLAIKETFGLTGAQVKSLLVLNVSMAIPARIIVGMATDKYGPRKVYSALLFIAAIPCFFFAFAQSYVQLAIASFALGFVGAGVHGRSPGLAQNFFFPLGNLKGFLG